MRNITPTTAPLTAALNQLLSIHTYNYGMSGLVDPLCQSSLSIKSITRSGSTWNIYLQGTVQLGGVCDIPRVEDEIHKQGLACPQPARSFVRPPGDFRGQRLARVRDDHQPSPPVQRRDTAAINVPLAPPTLLGASGQAQRVDIHAAFRCGSHFGGQEPGLALQLEGLGPLNITLQASMAKPWMTGVRIVD